MEEETIASIVTNEVTNLTESSSTTVPEILITYLDDYEDEDDDDDDDDDENITTNIINEFTTPKNETDTTVKVYVLPASRRPAYLQSF
jgi:hypothetical protein